MQPSFEEFDCIQIIKIIPGVCCIVIFVVIYCQFLISKLPRASRLSLHLEKNVPSRPVMSLNLSPTNIITASTIGSIYMAVS